MKRLIALIISLVAIVVLMFGGDEAEETAVSEEDVQVEEVRTQSDPYTIEDAEEFAAWANEKEFNVNPMSEPSTVHLSDDFSIDITDGVIALVNVGEDGHLFDVPDGTSTPVIGFDLVVSNGGGEAEKVNIGQSTLVTSTGEQLDAVSIYDVPESTFRGGTNVDEGVTFLLRNSMPTDVEWVDWYVRYDGEEVKHRIEFDGFGGF